MKGKLIEELRLQDLKRYGRPNETYRILLKQRIDLYDPEGKKGHAVAEKIDKDDLQSQGD
ncbi:MAG TPA: hypothetical protein VJ485_02210 [archaeon]|nr:hypothetical protein [archaeon]